MTRLLIPLILVIAAIGLFVVYTDPTYQASKSIQAQVASYNDALTKSQQLRAVRDQLLSKRNTFAPSDVQKLQTILPDNVDNIRLIIDINNIAVQHGLTLSNVQLGTVSGSASTKNALSVGAPGSAVGSVDVGFSITSSYANMLAFLQDLEHSLRLVDVEKLNFQANAADLTNYTFTIRTYWLQ